VAGRRAFGCRAASSGGDIVCADCRRWHGISTERTGDKYRMSLPADAEVDVIEFDNLLSKPPSVPHTVISTAESRRRSKCLTSTRVIIPAHRSLGSERHRYRRSAAESALASDYHALGECDLAMKVASRSIALSPEDETSWLIIADLLGAAGDHVGAEHVRLERAQMQGALGA